MKLLQANAFQIPLENKSVGMCVTSPPYYSLRRYSGEQEFIFGGDKDCEHEFESHERYHGAPVGKSKTRWQHTDGGSPKTHPEQYEVGPAGTKRVSLSAFCHKCNAWRGAYGLEPTLQMYIDHTVEWCREVWRVLRDDGSFWLNLGDAYNGSGGAGGDYNKGGLKEGQPKYPGRNDTQLKPKDLMGIPWRVALALQADGWFLRSDIIWSKTNPMPESCTDRPTKSHEYLFLLTKKKNYCYDADAVREKATHAGKVVSLGEKSFSKGQAKGAGVLPSGNATKETYTVTAGRNKRTVWTIATAPYSGAHFATYPPALVEPCIKAGTSEKGVCPECGNPWERVTKPTEEYQVVLDSREKKFRPHKNDFDNRAFSDYLFQCRKSHQLSKSEIDNGLGTNTAYAWWEGRNYMGEFIRQTPSVENYGKLKEILGMDNRFDDSFAKYHLSLGEGAGWEKKGVDSLEVGNSKSGQSATASYETLGWQPTCEHDLDPIPATVIDVFAGSGTTLLVARKLGRNAIGLDISGEYLDLAKERLGLKGGLPGFENV